jgi:hypothetical protein
VRRRQRADAPVDAVGELVERRRPAAGQGDDREHVGERVLDPVVELAGQRVADRGLLLEPAQRRLVLDRLLRQHAHDQHQQAGDEQAEDDRRHRQARESCAGRRGHRQGPRLGPDRDVLERDRARRGAVAGAREQVGLCRGAIVERDFIALGGFQLERRSEEFGRVERAVDVALEPSPLGRGLEHRHEDEEARPAIVDILAQHDLAARGRPRGALGLDQRRAPDRLGEEIIAERAPVALGVGLQVRHRHRERLAPVRTRVELHRLRGIARHQRVERGDLVG